MREDLREKVEEAVRTIKKAERIAERMEAKQRNIDARDYPKYKDAVIRTIERIKRTRPHVNWYYERMTAEQIFKWWISNEPISVYFNALVNSSLIEKDAIV